jgi:hypothetical protein
MIAFTRSLGPDLPGDVWVMNADGSGQRALTSTDVIEESPDWQPIPVFAGASGPRRACGDLSLEPGGVASVVAVRVRCDQALRVAARWQAGKKDGFVCSQTRHSMDQSAVECVKRSCPHGSEKRIAFVFRDPAQAQARSRVGGAEPEPSGEPIPDDDALPRDEEE